MPKVFKVEIQVIGNDQSTEEQVENQITAALNSIKVLDSVYVQEVKYYGDIEES